MPCRVVLPICPAHYTAGPVTFNFIFYGVKELQLAIVQATTLTIIDAFSMYTQTSFQRFMDVVREADESPIRRKIFTTPVGTVYFCHPDLVEPEPPGAKVQLDQSEIYLTKASLKIMIDMKEQIDFYFQHGIEPHRCGCPKRDGVCQLPNGVACAMAYRPPHDREPINLSELTSER